MRLARMNTRMGLRMIRAKYADSLSPEQREAISAVLEFKNRHVLDMLGDDCAYQYRECALAAGNDPEKVDFGGPFIDFILEHWEEILRALLILLPLLI